MSESAAKKIEDPAEMLHRQVDPQYVDDGRLSSQVFCPMPKDDGWLSVSAGSIVSAEKSFQRFVERGCRSAGVSSVSVQECSGLKLAAYFDALSEEDDGGPDDAHALIDMHELPKGQQKKRAKKLAESARNRGWSYQSGGGPR